MLNCTGRKLYTIGWVSHLRLPYAITYRVCGLGCNEASLRPCIWEGVVPTLQNCPKPVCDLHHTSHRSRCDGRHWRRLTALRSAIREDR